MTTSTQMNQEQLGQWVKEQFQRANKHLAENGVLFDTVVTEESRYLAPYFAIWKIKSNEGKYFWVICGDLPCDFMPYENEKTAREAIRHFSFLWQLQAENIQKAGELDKTQKEFVEMLIARAEGLYRIYNQQEIWQDPTGDQV